MLVASRRTIALTLLSECLLSNEVGEDGIAGKVLPASASSLQSLLNLVSHLRSERIACCERLERGDVGLILQRAKHLLLPLLERLLALMKLGSDAVFGRKKRKALSTLCRSFSWRLVRRLRLAAPHLIKFAGKPGLFGRKLTVALGEALNARVATRGCCCRRIVRCIRVGRFICVRIRVWLIYRIVDRLVIGQINYEIIVWRVVFGHFRSPVPYGALRDGRLRLPLD